MSKNFYFFIFLYAFSLPISLSLTNLSLFLLFLSVVVICFKNKEFPRIPKSLFILAVFFLWAASTMVFSAGQFEFSFLNSFRKLWNFFPYFLIPAVGMGSEKPLYSILKTVVITASLVVILGLLEFSFGTQYFFSGWFGFEKFFSEGRFYGFQSHPLHAGGIYTILFLVSLSLWLFHKSYAPGTVLEPKEQWTGTKEKVLWFLCSVLLGLAVFLTGSRSYYLALSAGFFVLLCMKSVKTFFSGFALAFLFVVAFSFFNPYIAHRIKTILPSQTDESGKQRLYMWKAALTMIREHPVRGVGYKRWREELPAVASRFPDWKMEDAALSHAHNSYLTVSAETGLVGFGLMLAFWGLLFKEQFKILFHSKKGTLSYALTIATLASILALLTAAFFEHNLFTAINSHTLFFLIGLSRAIAK